MFINSNRPPEAQTLHDTMISTLATNLASQGYRIYADITGFEQPPKVGRHIPDIYAFKLNSRIIVEVETSETIGINHTKEQYTDFSNVRGTDFHVMVPERSLATAQAYAESWGITVDKWWYQRGY
jgi:hypothetical protein